MIPTKRSFFSPAQEEALQKLRTILKLATSPIRPGLHLSTRTHTLVTGPSGSGKSFLAKALAKEAQIPFWEANVSSWIILGARNGNPSFVSLTQWVSQHPRGIIFLDELEKPFPYTNGGAVDSTWFNSVKMEIHDLLDNRLPDGAIHIDEAGLMDSYGDQISVSDYKDLIKFDVENKLKNSFLVIGAGTWQHLWTENKGSIGFNKDSSPVVSLDQGKLMKSISPEVLLRFRNQVMFLPPMTVADFNHVLREQLFLIPSNYRERYATMVQLAIPRALEFGLGMRIFEEVYTDLCCEIIFNCSGDPEVLRDVLIGRAFAP